MKKSFLILFGLIAFSMSASQAFAIDMRKFHNRNFQASDDACGLHVEVSGNYFSYTNIVPPREGSGNVSCSDLQDCNGSTYVAECDASGKCYSRLSGEVDIILLNDGNFVFVKYNRKFRVHNRSNYLTCR